MKARQVDQIPTGLLDATNTRPMNIGDKHMSADATRSGDPQLDSDRDAARQKIDLRLTEPTADGKVWMQQVVVVEDPGWRSPSGMFGKVCSSATKGYLNPLEEVWSWVAAGTRRFERYLDLADPNRKRLFVMVDFHRVESDEAVRLLAEGGSCGAAEISAQLADLVEFQRRSASYVESEVADR